MSKPSVHDQEYRVMFTDRSTRDFIITADNIEEAEKVFDMIFNHMEQSINDLLLQYKVGKKTKVWVEYFIDKEQDVNEEDNE
jgi:DNA-binding protein Fis